MTTKFIQPGHTLDHVAGSAISSSDVVEMGNLVGVAKSDIANGDTGAVMVDGVFELPKATGSAWNQGDVLDWDTSATEFGKGITPATGDITGCAIAAEDAASGDATGKVLLRAIPGTVN